MQVLLKLQQPPYQSVPLHVLPLVSQQLAKGLIPNSPRGRCFENLTPTSAEDCYIHATADSRAKEFSPQNIRRADKCDSFPVRMIARAAVGRNPAWHRCIHIFQSCVRVHRETLMLRDPMQ